jgi:hypothetical protein
VPYATHPRCRPAFKISAVLSKYRKVRILKLLNFIQWCASEESVGNVKRQMFCKHSCSCIEWTDVAGTYRSGVQDVTVAFIGWAACCSQGGPSYVPRPSLKLIIIDHIFINVTGTSSSVNILVN